MKGTLYLEKYKKKKWNEFQDRRQFPRNLREEFYILNHQEVWGKILQNSDQSGKSASSASSL